MQEIYTTVEVAEHLHLAPSTVAAYAASGQFPGAFKIGIDWRFPEASVTEFINARTPQKTDPYQIAPRSRRAQAARRRTA